MSQATKNIANMARSAFRAANNAALQALETKNSGATEPTETYAYQEWADTTSGWLKQRNAANDAWIEVRKLADATTTAGEALRVAASAAAARAAIGARGEADDVTLAAGKGLIFEGATDDAFETTVTAEDPTADRSQTLPNMSGQIAVQARGADIASASTINLTTATGDIVDVTGTTTITAITLADGLERKVRFTGALTLTHGASLVLPSGANITTAAGDFAVFRGYASGIVRCVSYTKANGQAVAGSGGLTLGTSVASTSGTSIDFTSIPAGTKHIILSFAGVSTSGSSKVIVQLGDSGGVETSGYSGAVTFAETSIAATSFSSGFITDDTTNAAGVRHGSIVLTLIDASANTWAYTGNIGRSDSASICVGAGSKSLSATLDRVRVTTVGGTDTFDAGTINIAYE